MMFFVFQKLFLRIIYKEKNQIGPQQLDFIEHMAFLIYENFVKRNLKIFQSFLEPSWQLLVEIFIKNGFILYIYIYI